MQQKLHLITLGVENLAVSVRFYEGLGWRRSPKSGGDLVLFPLGGIALALYPRKLLAQDAAVANDRAGFSGIAVSLNMESEREVDAALDEARLLGARIAKPAQKTSWGGYSGYFQDPDGYLFEIAYNPFWDFDERGNLRL